MNIIVWIYFGALAGGMVPLNLAGGKQVGWPGNIGVGMVGSVLSGLWLGYTGGVGVTGFDRFSIIGAMAGSIVLVWIGRIFRQFVARVKPQYEVELSS